MHRLRSITMARRFSRTVPVDSDAAEFLAALAAPTTETSVKPPETIHSLREIPLPERFFPAADMKVCLL
jgi:hypothetical protein